MKIMKIPDFWKKKKHWLGYALFPFSLIYYTLFQLNKIKQSTFKKKINIKTICVGNIYIGGTGKTPLTEKIYQSLKNVKKICVIKKFRYSQIDEINMLNSNTKIFTPKHRLNGILDAEHEGFEVAILDDGAQDYSFRKNLSILCIKSNRGFGNEKILPAGPLREPLYSIKQYQIAVINGEKNLEIENILKKFHKDIKIFYSNYSLMNKQDFLNKKFFAFSGISDNGSFFKLLEKNNIDIFESKPFPDHHIFSDAEIESFILKYKGKNIDLITTEKNYHSIPLKYRKNIFFTKIELKIDNIKDFLNEIN